MPAEPDVAFIRRDRLPDPEPLGFPDLLPGFECPLATIL